MNRRDFLSVVAGAVALGARGAAAEIRAVETVTGPVPSDQLGVTLVHVVTWQNLRGWTPNEKLLGLLGLTAVAWFLLELRAVSALKAMLGPNLYERLKGQLGKTRNRYRLLPAAGYVVALFLGEFILRVIAHFRYGTAIF